MNNIRIHPGTRHRFRTVATDDRHWPANVGRALVDAWTQLVRSLPRPVKGLLAWAAQPRVYVPFCALIVLAIAVTAHYTIKFSNEIDERLQSGLFDKSVGIFTAPFRVAPGDHLPIAELADHLDGAGYGRRPNPGAGGAGRSYAISGDAVEIHPDPATARELGLTPVRVVVDRNGRIEALTQLETDERLRSAFIEGGPLASLREGDRRKQISVAFADVPARLRDAVMAIEDRRFFSHNGIDLPGIARALWADLHHGTVVQGGSTLTQQLVKNAFLTSDRTLGRKLKEAMMAMILESRLSKEEIFTLYCNNVYLGQDRSFAIHGFAQAAKVYFDKPLGELTLGECALLAGLIHAPNRYSLVHNAGPALERRNAVLDAMAETEAITGAEAESAKREPLLIKKQAPREDYGAAYFIDYVERFVTARDGANAPSAERRVVTTMDPRLQRAAHAAVIRHTERLDRVRGRKPRKGEAAKPVQAALVALDAHTGEVLAMIGGRSYDESQLNRATDARRQPGSTFKPFVYAAALSDRRHTPASLLSDRPQTFTFDGGRAEYKPSNYHGGFSNRDVTLREALARSLNVPAVELAMDVGLGSVAGLARACGLELDAVYPSTALGTTEATPMEMAGAYTAFANGGLALRPLPVKSIRSASARESAVSAASRRAFSPQVAYLMTSMMESVVEEGTAARLRGYGLSGAIAGKTGTSNDGWFVGYTPNLVCAVWVGYDDNTDMRMKASDTALPLWADFVKEAIRIRPELGGDTFTRPAGIVEVEVDPTTGLRAGPDCAQGRMELFLEGAIPYADCRHDLPIAEADPEMISPYTVSEEGQESSLVVTVCADTGLLASSGCPRSLQRTFAWGSEPSAVCDLEHSRSAPEVDPERGQAAPALRPAPQAPKPRRWQ